MLFSRIWWKWKRNSWIWSFETGWTGSRNSAGGRTGSRKQWKFNSWIECCWRAAQWSQEKFLEIPFHYHVMTSSLRDNNVIVIFCKKMFKVMTLFLMLLIQRFNYQWSSLAHHIWDLFFRHFLVDLNKCQRIPFIWTWCWPGFYHNLHPYRFLLFEACY